MRCCENISTSHRHIIDRHLALKLTNFQPRNYQFPAQKLPISSPEITNFQCRNYHFTSRIEHFSVSFSSPEITNFQPRNYQFPAQKLPISSPEISKFWQ